MSSNDGWYDQLQGKNPSISCEFLDVGFLKQLLEVPIERLSQSTEKKLRTILESLEDNLLKEVNYAVPDPEKKNEYLIELMKKKSVAGAGLLKYSQNVLNCVRVYRVVKPKQDLVMVNTSIEKKCCGN